MRPDRDLQHDVLAELKWEPSVNAAHIGVTAANGVVTLTGHVSTYMEKIAAERAAKRIFGVKAVADEVEVRLPGTVKHTDEDIAAACVAALAAKSTVPNDKVTVVVKRGWVTLEGEVEWHYQKEAAMNAVRDLFGVTGVSNAITVKVRALPSDVANRIEDAFTRSAEIDARRIRVATTDGKVILNGTVRTWLEWDEAQRAAWAAPGVTAVENQITVAP
jgi:osmotically-inducible protein OsmY